jgi:hypothetical protein
MIKGFDFVSGRNIWRLSFVADAMLTSTLIRLFRDARNLSERQLCP